MMKKKTLALFAVIIGLTLLLPRASAASFTDTQGHWGAASIDRWANQGVLTGFADGTYRPNQEISRSELAKALNNVMRYTAKASNTFTDLPGSHPNADPLLKLVAAGIMEGFNGRVRPDDTITREEAITMVAKVFQLEPFAGGAGAFTDVGSLADWSKPYIGALRSNGYVEGYQGKFDPAHRMTRVEIAKLLDNMVTALYSSSGTYTGDATRAFVVVNTSGVTLKDMTVRGDLILAQGVGSGNVYLQNVRVYGRTLVYGGGSNSVHITGTSLINTAHIKNENSAVRIVVSDTASVDSLYVDQGCQEVILEGTLGMVEAGEGTTITANTAAITTLNMSGDNAAATLDRSSTVKYAKAQGNNTSMSIQGQVSSVVVTGNYASLTGNGAVANVSVRSGRGTKVTVPGTVIDVDNTAGSVSMGSSSVSSGNTGTVPGSNTWTSYLPSISSTTATYNAKNPSDLSFDVDFGTGTWKASTILTIKNSSSKLTSRTDYRLSGNTLTIYEDYLKSRPLGTLTLTVSFDDTHDTDVKLTIYIVSKTTISDINTLSDIAAPVAGAAPPADLTVDSAANYTAKITWSGLDSSGHYTSASKAIATVRLTAGSSYTFTGLTAAKAQNVFASGTPTVNISSSSGDNITITLTYTLPPLPRTVTLVATDVLYNGLLATPSMDKTTYSAGETATLTVTLEGTALKPGSHEITAKNSQVTITGVTPTVVWVSAGEAVSKVVTYTFVMPEADVTSLVIANEFLDSAMSLSGIPTLVAGEAGSTTFTLTTVNVPAGTAFTVSVFGTENIIQETLLTTTAGSTLVTISTEKGVAYSTQANLYTINVQFPLLTLFPPQNLYLTVTPAAITTPITIHNGAPAVGIAPSSLTPTYAGMSNSTAATVTWREGTTGAFDFTGTFESGKTYCARYVFTAGTGYLFSSNMSVTVDTGVLANSAPAVEISGQGTSTLTATVTWAELQ